MLKKLQTIFKVFVIIFVLLAGMAYMGIQSPFVPFIFLSGGIWSAVSGYLGMKTATNASARTANACQESLDKGLKISFRGGAIMGLMVVGFGLLDVSFWFFLLNYIYDHNIFNVSLTMLSNTSITEWNPNFVQNEIFQKLKLF